MKKMLYMVPVFVFLLSACSGIGGSSDDHSEFTDLSIREQVSGTIETVGEVDWYRFRAVESNNVLQVSCTSETLRPDVDLLVSVFQMDEAGNKSRLYADHAPDGGLAPANITLHTYIDQPKDIYISVRDLKDNDASDNPYYLSVDFSGVAEENDNFTTASTVTVNSDDSVSDSIGYVGDVDCFQFASSGGIYDVHVEFLPFSDTSVQLSIDLYNSTGERVSTQTSSNRTSFHLIHYLPEGNYYIHVDDYGMDNFDTASTYQVQVNSVESSEQGGNDTIESATPVTIDEYDSDYSIEGSIDYAEDQDWFALSLPPAGDGFRVLDLRFLSLANCEFLINVMDENNTPLLSHTYKGLSDQYQTWLKLPDNSCFLMVQPAPAANFEELSPYELTVQIKNVVDTAEVSPNENDSIETSDELTATSDPLSATNGKIGYRGDVDWYHISIPPHTAPQVLEVFLSVPLSDVEYALSVIGTNLEEKIYNSTPDTVPTNLKTSFLIPENEETERYSFRVGDFQDDDGDEVVYSIRVDLKDIPDTLPELSEDAAPYGETIEYVNQATLQDDGIVTLEYNPVTRKSFGYTSTFLDVETAVVEENTPETGQTKITFPWLAGYVDYQGDQDFFQIDFQPLDTSDNWYYEISVDFYAPASSVEYVWKFYPDRNDNQVLAERASGYDGFIASAGDTNTEEETITLSTPSASDEPFWLNHSWQGTSFFSISDFNYMYTESGVENPNPDNDWGEYGTSPYYMKVTLIYHSGESRP